MLVSVCTIARNEEEYLPHLLEDITKQNYPAEQIEVVMVDSSSTDGTRRIMERFAEKKNAVPQLCCYRKSGKQSGIWLESGNSQFDRRDHYTSGCTWTYPRGFCFQECGVYGKRRGCHRGTKAKSSGEGYTVAEIASECRKFNVRKWNCGFPERE